MPTPKKGPRLGGSPAHQKAILSNLATSLFEHGAVTTTEAKARMLRPYAERLITKARRGDLHNRRQVMSVIRDKGVVHTLFTEIGPRFAERPGGYTRITKIGPRKGDNAPMAVIALVQEELAANARSSRGTGSTGSSTAAATAGPAAGEASAGGAASDDTTADETASADAGLPDGADEELAAQTDEQEAVADQESQGEIPSDSDADADADGATESDTK